MGLIAGLTSFRFNLNLAPCLAGANAKQHSAKTVRPKHNEKLKNIFWFTSFCSKF
jgi:hypothetical protein